MFKRKENAFTLIELIEVLVIMAILALIVIPLVMNTIRMARISADKRSVDAYGRSIELAIAGYLLDTGSFPTSVDQLTIEYSGKKVECTTTQINEDSSVYLAGCTVNGRNVEGYTYGKNKNTYPEYSLGDYVLYNNISYFVLEDSDSTNDTVKLLKETPLTYREMGLAESDDYGRIQFGESTDYNQSTVKQKVDAWVSTAVKDGDNVTSRLIKVEDLTDNLGYEYYVNASGKGAYNRTENTPNWVYSNDWYNWTMIQVEDSSDMWLITEDGGLTYSSASNENYVRPVLELKKSADIKKSTYYKSYSIGDTVTYNNIDYYVIKNSKSSEENVTLLKAEPLTTEEVNQYGGVGTDDNHINRYTYNGTARDVNGYGAIAYYTSQTCRFDGTNWINDGCKNDYDSSDVKYVVDAWKTSNASKAIEARLITFEELTTDLGCSSDGFICRNSFDGLYSFNYWTMSSSNDASSIVWYVSGGGGLDTYYVDDGVYVYNIFVRPVITISKSVLQ